MLISLSLVCVDHPFIPEDKKSAAIREGALLCLEGLTINLGCARMTHDVL